MASNTICAPDIQSLLGRRPKVVIGHPYLGRGGSEARVMWLIEALKRDCDVTVATTGGWNLADLNAYYGTHIRESEVSVRIAPLPYLARNRSVAALRGACYQRFARQIAHEYDVRISAYNPTDWGLPAIHFIADFSWHKEIRERLHPLSPGAIYQDTVWRRMYLRIAASFANPSGRDVLQDDQMIANSAWTASVIRETFGVSSVGVIYPPVWSEFPEISFVEKERAFILIGRISPEKKIEDAIAILNEARRHGHAIRLHLCGGFGEGNYAKQIGQLCRQNSDWIVVEGQVSGARKEQILAMCQFGIQATSAESFGISIAEMVKAGAVVFAPDNGGQAEILDHPGLLYENRENAVEKICAVLSSAERCDELRNHLKGQAELFSAEAFMQGARACVANFIEVDSGKVRAAAATV